MVPDDLVDTVALLRTGQDVTVILASIIGNTGFDTGLEMAVSMLHP